MQIWVILLASFGGPAILLIALGFFSKALVKQLLEKDIEEFKNSLKIATLEHEVIFSRLHDKKIEIIADLYSSLKEALFKAQVYVSIFGNQVEPTREEKRKAFYEAIMDFSAKFEKNKIWLDETLAQKVEDMYQEFIEPARELVVAEALATDERVASKKYEKWFEAYEKYQKDVPEAISSLEAEFRKELGVINARRNL